MRMIKIKINKDDSLNFEFLIILEEKPGDEKDIFLSTKMKSNLKGEADFYTALAELKPFVLDMCELPADDLGRLKITGVMFTHTKDGIMGAQISAERKLNHAEKGTDLTTPHRTAAPYSSDDSDQILLTPDCCEALEILIGETENYLAGHRSQIGLFNGKVADVG